MRGVIRPDASYLVCECGGKFKKKDESEYKHPVPRCENCGKAPAFLRVRITLPGLQKIDVRWNQKGTRLKTLAMADAFLQDVHDEIRTGTFDPSKYLSPKMRGLLKISNFLNLYLEEKRNGMGKEPGCSPAYVFDCESIIKHHLMPFFGEMDVTDLRYSHLKAFLMQPNKSRRQMSKGLGILRPILREASKSVRFTVPEFPKLPTSKTKRGFPDFETQQLIYRHVKIHRGAIGTLILYPVRPCEVTALKHKDISRSSNTVTFRRHHSRGMVLEGRKSASDTNDRYHALSFSLLPEFLDILDSQPTPIDEEAYVFTTTRGKPIYRNALYKEWTKACKRAGVKHVSLYEGTKHSLLTQLRQNSGLSIDDIRELAGHTDRRSTDRYVEANSIKLSEHLSRRKFHPHSTPGFSGGRTKNHQ